MPDAAVAQRATPLKINFEDNPHDRMVQYMLQNGFSYQAVHRVTGLTMGQVGGRAQRLPLASRAGAYRRGEGKAAESLVLRLKKAAQLIKRVNAHLNGGGK
jgi:hypothetical protein